MQHKQNAVVQRCVVGLAGVFSVIGLALFWQQDFAEAQTPVVRERFTQIVTDTQKFTTTEFSQALVAAQNFTDGEISQLLTATQNFTDAEFRQVLDKVRVGRSFNQLLAELQGDATMRVLPNQIWGIDNKKEYLISLTFLKSGDNAMEGGVWKADANATSARGAILATGEVRVGSSNESSAGITAAFFWGGTGNRISVSNATILGGAKNRAINNAESSVVLGGESNSIGARNSFIWWGISNQVSSSTQANSLVLGGEQNWNWGATSMILGMKNNTVADNGESNVIVGTNTRTANATRNVFVWSDTPTGDQFLVNNSNTFYINTQKGVWVNTATPAVKFDSRGAVQVGAVGNSSSCTVGQIGTISSGSTTCLCACTSNGAWKSMVDDENGTCEMVCNKDSLRSASCTGKPDNSSYNTATSVIQTLHGGVWTPSTVATYNITPSTTECRYTCNPGYVRNGSLCAPTRNITINSEVWLATPMPGGINVDIEVHEIYHMFRYDSLSSQQTYTRSYALNGLFPDVLSIQMTYTLTNVNMQGDGVYKVELINPATQAVIQTVADAWSPPTQNDISSLAYNLPITTATSYSIPTLKISPSTTQVYTLTVNPGGITFPWNYNTIRSVPAPTGTSYTISYNINGGSSTVPSSVTSTKPFTSWTLAGYGNISSSTTNPTNYTFGAGNGTLTANYGVQPAIILPAAPTRANYTFNGWYTAASGGTKRGNAGATYTPTGSETLYAQWISSCPLGSIVHNASARTITITNCAGNKTITIADRNVGASTYGVGKLSCNNNWFPELLAVCDCVIDADCVDASVGSYYTNAQALSICPSGYHLPSSAEWGDLLETRWEYRSSSLSLGTLSSRNGYPYTDNVPFNVTQTWRSDFLLPLGWLNAGDHWEAGVYGNYWSRDNDPDYYMFHQINGGARGYTNGYYPMIYAGGRYSRWLGDGTKSVRCFKDSTTSTPVNGVCGSANGRTFTQPIDERQGDPVYDSLCSYGIPTEINISTPGKAKWRCQWTPYTSATLSPRCEANVPIESDNDCNRSNAMSQREYEHPRCYVGGLQVDHGSCRTYNITYTPSEISCPQTAYICCS